MASRIATPRSLAALVLVTLALACGIAVQRSVPPQSWLDERGPVVPHDSFPADCSLCHEGDGWSDIRNDFTFNHAAETGMALEGAHSRAECLRCHNDRGPVEIFAQRGCAGCHEDVHRGMLGKICSDCHQQEDWRPLEPIARHSRTRFPLIGAHASAACWRCHPGAQVGNFSRADTECVTCHQSDLARAAMPDHAAMGWTSSCDRCHIPTSWSGAGFVHTAFPLTGVHAVIDCTDCHTGNVFSGTPADCSACHLAEYNSADDPDHQALMFSLDCEDCHTTSSWEGALFSHAGITMNCAMCHADDYKAAKDPDHVASMFSTSCEDCHTTGTWQGAAFDHAGITNGCFECHADDYQATTKPNHMMAGFPTSCETCHNTNTWSGAVFSHSFPINGGDHGALDCSDCHLQPRNLSVFTCTKCHEHLQPDMDDEHDRVPGYVYQSQACLNCHPDGED